MNNILTLLHYLHLIWWILVSIRCSKSIADSSESHHGSSVPTTDDHHHNHHQQHQQQHQLLHMILTQRLNKLKSIALYNYKNQYNNITCNYPTHIKDHNNQHNQQHHQQYQLSSYVYISEYKFGQSGNNLIEFTHGLWVAKQLNATFIVPSWMIYILTPFNMSILKSQYCFIYHHHRHHHNDNHHHHQSHSNHHIQQQHINNINDNTTSTHEFNNDDGEGYYDITDINQIINNKNYITYEITSEESFFAFQLFTSNNKMKSLLPKLHPYHTFFSNNNNNDKDSNFNNNIDDNHNNHHDSINNHHDSNNNNNNNNNNIDSNESIIFDLSIHYLKVYSSLWCCINDKKSMFMIEKLIEYHLNNDFNYSSIHKRQLDGGCNKIMNEVTKISDYNSKELPMSHDVWNRNNMMKNHPLCEMKLSFVLETLKINNISINDDYNPMNSGSSSSSSSSSSSVSSGKIYSNDNDSRLSHHKYINHNNTKLFVAYDGSGDISDYRDYHAVFSTVLLKRHPELASSSSSSTILKHIDMMIAMHSNLFILNPRSTFSWQIYVIRVSAIFDDNDDDDHDQHLLMNCLIYLFIHSLTSRYV